MCIHVHACAFVRMYICDVPIYIQVFAHGTYIGGVVFLLFYILVVYGATGVPLVRAISK